MPAETVVFETSDLVDGTILRWNATTGMFVVITPIPVIAAVATANADATYGQPEADLINELKSKVNLLLAGLKANAPGILAPS